MKRFRLSTLLLLVVIAALAIALAMERNQSAALERRIPRITVHQAGGVTIITERTLADEATGAGGGAKK